MAGMTTYHISKKTYQPAPCTARPGHCPLKGQHYPTMAQAQAVAEAALSKQYGQTISLS